jgi:urease accessory protein
MFPRVGNAGIEEAVVMNTAGGVAGGDRLDTVVTALADANITVTSQTAEKIYRALDEPARISTTVTVGEAAKLAWCPQETIVFDRARVRRETHIVLSSRAELLALEWLVGRLVWADTAQIADDMFPHLRRNGTPGGFHCLCHARLYRARSRAAAGVFV